MRELLIREGWLLDAQRLPLILRDIALTSADIDLSKRKFH